MKSSLSVFPFIDHIFGVKCNKSLLSPGPLRFYLTFYRKFCSFMLYIYVHCWENSHCMICLPSPGLPTQSLEPGTLSNQKIRNSHSLCHSYSLVWENLSLFQLSVTPFSFLSLCIIWHLANPIAVTVLWGGMSTHTSAWDSWTLTGKSVSVFCGDTAPFSWVLMQIRFCLCPPRVYFPNPVEVLLSNPTGLQSQIPWRFSVPCWIPRLGCLLQVLELS